jgi:hypothetical protein
VEQLNHDSEQIREVYARYGLAMYQAQCVERGLAILLATAYRPGLTKITRSQYKELLESLFKKSFGGLTTHLRKSVNVPDDLEGALQEARNKRNWLAHHYFWDRAGHFMTDKGRWSMIDELQAIADNLDRLDKQLSEITQEWAKKHGITEQMLQLEMEKLIQWVENLDTA